MKTKKPNAALLKEVRALLNHISLIQRKCREQNTWLSAGVDPYKPLTDEAQQGPMVNKLYDLTKQLRTTINKK